MTFKSNFKSNPIFNELEENAIKVAQNESGTMSKTPTEKDMCRLRHEDRIKMPLSKFKVVFVCVCFFVHLCIFLIPRLI